VFEGTPPARHGQSWFVHAAPPDHIMHFAGGAGRHPASVRDDLTFTLDGVFVPARLSLSGLPVPWVVREIRYGGRDVAYAYTDFAKSREPVEIVVTNRSGIVSGRVTADDGESLSAARVVMFPADPNAREFAGAESLSTIRDDGTYQTAPRPPGDYLIVAARLPDGRQWTDPGILEALLPLAERVTLLDNDRRVTDLRVVEGGVRR
jgi:hypothetical protein